MTYKVFLKVYDVFFLKKRNCLSLSQKLSSKKCNEIIIIWELKFNQLYQDQQHSKHKY